MSERMTTELLELATALREEDILLVGYGILEDAAEQLTSARAIMEKFAAFMDEYYSIRGAIEPLSSDTEEDRLLKETYAEMKEWLDD